MVIGVAGFCDAELRTFPKRKGTQFAIHDPEIASKHMEVSLHLFLQPLTVIRQGLQVFYSTIFSTGHPEKAPGEMSVALFGIVRLVRDAQLANALPGMLFTLLPSITFESTSQSSNEAYPIFTTLSENVTLVKKVFPSKAQLSMRVTPFGIVTSLTEP